MYSEKEYNDVQINLALTEKKLYEKDRELNLTHELLEKYRMVFRLSFFQTDKSCSEIHLSHEIIH